jgi:predicted transposase YbfD/YdcC
MSLVVLDIAPKPRMKVLLEHFGRIEDPREPWRVAHPLPEVLFLVVCGTIADCDDYDAIADWGTHNLSFLREFLPYYHGVPGGRWLTLLMNRINPALFAAAFTSWVRASWPDRPDFVAIDGKTSRRSHDRSTGAPPLHLVSAFATTARLVLGQEAVPDKASETTAIPLLIARLAENDGLRGTVISIDAIATNPTIAGAIKDAGADYLLAVKANQPGLRAEIESVFDDPACTRDIHRDLDKGHGRIEERVVTVAREVDWLHGQRRFPGETRLPGIASLVRVTSRTQLKDRSRFETRFYVSSAPLSAARAAEAVRRHWAVESFHWVLDVVFADDQSRLRKGHGAHNMAIVRHFAFNLTRAAPEPPHPPRSPLKRQPRPGATPRQSSLKRRRKFAAWSNQVLKDTLGAFAR